MKLRMLLTVALCLLMVAGVWSQAMAEDSIDMGQYTCENLLQEDAATIGLILMWVDGYISSETEDLTISREWMNDMATRIGKECGANPDTLLIEIVEKMVKEAE